MCYRRKMPMRPAHSPAVLVALQVLWHRIESIVVPSRPTPHKAVLHESCVLLGQVERKHLGRARWFDV
jgi:hypothetical protein